jgi:D-alanine transaminase
MTRISYLNGQFLPHENCLIHIEDRGFQFADGAYEVTLLENNKLIDGDAHIERLFRSLREMKITHNLSKEQLVNLQLELFTKNNLSAGTCYIQVTRGFANRVPYLAKTENITISATISPRKKLTQEEFAHGFSFLTHDDIRWKRCDIKSVALFPSSMVNQEAKNQGYNDAIFIRDGFVTEGTFANIFMIDKNDTLITRAPDNFILQGITRNRIIALAKNNGMKVEERLFTLDELLNANEVFLSSSSLLIRPAREINKKLIGGDGNNRKITAILSQAYEDFITN